MDVELVWFGVEVAGLFARPRTLPAVAAGVEAALLAVAGVVVAVVGVDVGIGVVEVLELVVGSLRSSFEGVEARESLSLPLELAPSDFFALGVAPNGMRLAKIEYNYK